VTDYTLTWKSTPEERYDTDMMERAEEIAATYAAIIGAEGGTAFGDPPVSDNTLILSGDNEVNVYACAGRLTEYLSREVKVDAIPD
jgi:hypothetical protein